MLVQRQYATLSLMPFDEKGYELSVREATIERVKEHLKEIVHGEIVRYELPNIAALQFVRQQALSGSSLMMDMHGKTLS